MRNRLAPSRTPGLVQSDLGRDDPPRVVPSREPTGWQQRQATAEAHQVAMLNAWNQMAVSLGNILDFARAPAPGDVLAQITHVIPASGVITRTFPVEFAAVMVANSSTGILTISSQPPMSQAPSKGTGVVVVPPGISRTMPMRGTVVTIYGPVGSTFDFVVFSKPRDPSTGGLTSSSGSSSGVVPSGVLVAAGATTTQTVQLSSISFTRLVVVLSITGGAGSVQLVISGISPSGYVYPLLNPTAVSGVGVTPYRIGAALTPSPGAVANDVVPDLVRVAATVVGTVTYGIDYLGGK